MRPAKIGDRISFPHPDGVERPAIIEEITAAGGRDAAWIVVKDEETQIRYIGTLPLTEQERRAAERFGDAIFGKPSSSRKLQPDDPLGLYDWLLDAYRGMTREVALGRLAHHPMLEHYRTLSDADLRIRIAREDAKAIWSHRSQQASAAGRSSLPVAARP